ncbi:MAG: hypothetical protein KC978_19930, partial [Candidatus Omnitrophica bacterium]|nr:hypothetical protein [Candidatus Omnitrophota bacterium]
AVQEECRTVHSRIFLPFVNDVFDALAGAKKLSEDTLSSLESRGFDHRGPGCCLKDFSEYESDPRSEAHVKSIEAELRRLLIDRFEKDRRVPSPQEIVDLCVDRAGKMVTQEDSDAASLLVVRRDAAEVLEKGFRQAAPLLAVDPTGVTMDEITFVAIAEGEKSKAADLIKEVAARLQVPDLKFIPWPHHNEIIIFRAAFNIALSAVKPVARAEKALRGASLSQRLASYRAPIYAFLPFLTQKPSRLEAMRFCLMAFVVGFVFERGGEWTFKTKTGREQDLDDLSIDRVEEVFSDYTNAAESASWFCALTLSEGFQWAYNQIKTIGACKDLAKGEWPKALNEFIEDFKAVAREHHEDLS